MNTEFLFTLAIILLSTKALGLVTRKVHMPAVVGALIAGLVLGPSGVNIVHGSDFINQSAEIGVIIIMFLAGLDTDLDELKHTLGASLIIAIMGVIVTLLTGFFVYQIFFGGINDPKSFIKAVFVGVILSATSVSITVETLREMGKLKTKFGTAILGAAIIDDIIGVVILTLVTSFGDPDVNIALVIGKIASFFVLLLLVGVACKFLFNKVFHKPEEKRRVAVYGFVFCLIMSFIGEKYFGVADVTGAFFTGLILCRIGVNDYIAKKINVVSYMIFSPIFFASVGIKTDVSGLSSTLIMFTIVLVIATIVTKFVGCGIGALMCKLGKKEALIIGMGMVARGEVSLIIAEKGTRAGLLDSDMFPAVISVVVITSLVTPILVKLAIGKDKYEQIDVDIPIK